MKITDKILIALGVLILLFDLMISYLIDKKLFIIIVTVAALTIIYAVSPLLMKLFRRISIKSTKHKLDDFIKEESKIDKENAEDAEIVEEVKSSNSNEEFEIKSEEVKEENK